MASEDHITSETVSLDAIMENSNKKAAIGDVTSAEAMKNLEEEELGSTLIADRMAMSPRQFYRKFKEISPIAPSDLIKNYRMEKAARLLREEDLSIQDVIADVGISSRSYFYKEFARKFGMTPKDYREQHKNP